VLLVDFRQCFAQFGVRCRITEVATQVVKRLLESVPCFGAVVLRLQKPSDFLAKFIEADIVYRNTEDSELLGQEARFFQVIQGRNQFAHGEVTGGSEHDHYAWSCGPASLFQFIVILCFKKQRHVNSP